MPEGCLKQQKQEGKVDSSYSNTTHVNCVKQENILKEGLLLAKGVYPVSTKGVSYWLRGFCLHWNMCFCCGWSLRPVFVEAGKQPVAKESLATGCLPASTKTAQPP